MNITNIFIYNNLYTIWDRSVWILIDVKFDSVFYRYPDQWRFDLITSYCHACGQCCNVYMYMYVNIYWTRRNTSLTRISRKNYCTSRGKINLWDNTNSYQTSNSVYIHVQSWIWRRKMLYICLWFSSFFLEKYTIISLSRVFVSLGFFLGGGAQNWH